MTRVTPFILAPVAALLLAGCGGSSSSGKSGDGDGPENNLIGTAAVGAPIQGTITAACADGDGFSDDTVTSDANGNWGVEIDTARLPCALQVSYGDPAQTLHGYAEAEGTANITPLTDLIIAYSSGQMPSDWFASAGITLNLDTDEVLEAFENAGFTLPGGDFDPFTSAFDATAGDAYDDLLEALQKAIYEDTGIDDYAALLATVKDGTLSLPDAPEEEEEPGGGDEEPTEGSCGTGAGETSEQPSGPDLIGTCAGSHEVAFIHRDGSHGGTVIIGTDNSISFDSGINFSSSDAAAATVSDRINCCNRIDVDYSNGDKIVLYRSEQGELRDVHYTPSGGEPVKVSMLPALPVASVDGSGNLTTPEDIIAGTVEGELKVQKTALDAPQPHPSVSVSSGKFTLAGKASGTVFHDNNWTLQDVPAQEGVYHCEPYSGGIKVQLRTLGFIDEYGISGGGDNNVGRCTIEITAITVVSNQVTHVEGSFSAELMDNNRTVRDIVVDGYFKYPN